MTTTIVIAKIIWTSKDSPNAGIDIGIFASFFNVWHLLDYDEQAYADMLRWKLATIRRQADLLFDGHEIMQTIRFQSSRKLRRSMIQIIHTQVPLQQQHWQLSAKLCPCIKLVAVFVVVFVVTLEIEEED